MTSRPCTGLLGGTFDPIHRGHLDAADAARRVLGLDQVLLVPSHVPPHRPAEPHASAYHRFAMVALAALTAEHLRASDLELEAAGPSYTSITIGRLRQAGYARLALFFIVGADTFSDIASWRNYPDILEQCQFAVISRPGHPCDDLDARFPALAGKMLRVDPKQAGGDAGRLGPATPTTDTTAIHVIETPTADVSSTGIRHRLACGESIAGLVPDEVATYIRRHGLYSGPSADDGAAP